MVVSIVLVLCKRPLIDRFNINLPRTTKDQADYGKLVRKEDIQTGDLIFLKPDADQMAIMLGFM